MELKLKNIKASFLFKNNVVKNQNKQIIWKNGNFIFTIYRCSQKLVNVTGLKRAEEIEQQKNVLEEMFQQKVLKVELTMNHFGED